jgi:hypothetical protein
MNFKSILTFSGKAYLKSFSNQPAKVLDPPKVVHPEPRTVADSGTWGPTCHRPERGDHRRRELTDAKVSDQAKATIVLSTLARTQRCPWRDQRSLWSRSPPCMAMTKPPNYYGPHVLVIVLKTSNHCTCVPQNFKKPVGCPRETRIIHDLPSRITFQRHDSITTVYIINYIRV